MATTEKTEKPKKYDGERVLCNGCKNFRLGPETKTPICAKDNLILRVWFSGRPLYLAMYKNCKDKK